MRARDLDANLRGIAIEIPGASVDAVGAVLRALAATPPPDPLELAKASATRTVGKYDVHLTDALLLHSYASQRIDAGGLPQAAAGIVSGMDGGFE